MLNPSGEKTGNKKVDDMIEKKKQFFKNRKDKTLTLRSRLQTSWARSERTNLTEDDKVVRR